MLISELRNNSGINPCILNLFFKVAYQHLPQIYVSSRKLLLGWERNFFLKLIELKEFNFEDAMSEFDNISGKEISESSIQSRIGKPRIKLVGSIRTLKLPQGFPLHQTSKHKKFFGDLKDKNQLTFDSLQNRLPVDHPPSNKNRSVALRRPSHQRTHTEELHKVFTSLDEPDPGSIDASLKSPFPLQKGQINISIESIQNLLKHQHGRIGFCKGLKILSMKNSKDDQPSKPSSVTALRALPTESNIGFPSDPIHPSFPMSNFSHEDFNQLAHKYCKKLTALFTSCQNNVNTSK